MDECLVADSYKRASRQTTQSLFLAESGFFGHPRFNFPFSEIDQPDMPEETVIEGIWRKELSGDAKGSFPTSLP